MKTDDTHSSGFVIGFIQNVHSENRRQREGLEHLEWERLYVSLLFIHLAPEGWSGENMEKLQRDGWKTYGETLEGRVEIVRETSEVRVESMWETSEGRVENMGKLQRDGWKACRQTSEEWVERMWGNFRGTGGKLVGKLQRDGWKAYGESSEGRVESMWENFRGTGGKLVGKLQRDGWKTCGET